MTAWTKLVGDSGILDRLGELGPAIDESRARDDNALEDVEGLERIRAVLTFVGKRLDGADSNLLSASALGSLAGALGQVTQYVKLFATDGQQTHLANANATVDSVVGLFAQLLLPTKTNDLRGLREASDSYRDAMAERLRGFEASIEKASQDAAGLRLLLDGVSKDFDSAKTALGDDLAEFRAEVAAAQTDLSASHDAAKVLFDSGAETAVTRWASAFETAETARKATFDAAVSEAEEAFAKTRTSYDDELKATSEAFAAQLKAGTDSQDAALAALRARYVEQASSVVGKIQTHLKEVQDLVGVIGDHGVTSGFKKAADGAKCSVLFWQGVTLVSMVLLIGFTGFTAINLEGSAWNWIDVARRLLFAATVGALATYAASQTSRYQTAERKNRKLELELRALGPFLEPVAPEERQKFRLKIAEVFFGKEESSQLDKAGPATALHASADTLEKLLDLLKAYIEKK